MAEKPVIVAPVKRACKEASFCWVFAHNKSGEDAIIHLGKPLSISPHLTKTQARRLANALLAYCDDCQA